jgi:hypothetical protein
MVSEHQTVPWNPSLPIEVRQQLASECDAIAEACAACGVKVERNPGTRAIPNTIATTKFMIERTYRPSIEPPIFDSGYFACDATLTTLFSLYASNTKSPSLGGNPDKIQLALRHVHRSREVNPQSFLDNMLYASIILKAPDNNDPVLRYKHLHTALNSLITVYEQSRISKLKLPDLATQIFKLTSDTIKASQAVPWLSRSESLAIIIRAKRLLSSDATFFDLPDAKRAYAMLSLLEGVSSNDIGEIGRSLRADPNYKFDAVLISVWCDIHRGGPLNREDAEFLLENKLRENAPILSALVLWGLDRPEEAMRLLEETCARNPDWWHDLDIRRVTSLKGLQQLYGERFLRIAIQPR